MEGEISNNNLKILKIILEVCVVLMVLGLNFHFLQERINFKEIPGGDEGSWLSAATEFSKGNGYSTRWMEYHYLEPYTLPRPDDFRYPALVTLMGIVFSLFGVSYSIGLYVVAVIYLLFLICFYLTVRHRFDVTTALLTLCIVGVSLLQLSWNSVVYTEGLFGLVLCGIIYMSSKFSDKTKEVMIMAVLIGVLYLVRPNGLLFVPAFVIYVLFRFKKKIFKNQFLGVFFLTLLLVLLPWWVRNGIYFGNPFHIAGSAGMLRATAEEPATYTLMTFFHMNGFLFPLKRIAIGTIKFFVILHQYEHGLEVLPLLGVVVGIVRRKVFYHPFITLSFLITLVACFYASYGSWSGVRYFSAFLPFVYAYGIYQLLFLLKNVKVHHLAYNGLTAVLLIGVILPVVNPHRFYERKYSSYNQNHSLDIKDYVNELKGKLSEGEVYLSMQLGQLNFLTGRNCIGLQGVEFQVALEKSFYRFRPKVISLTFEELKNEKGLGVLTWIREQGYLIEDPIQTKIGVIFSIRKKEDEIKIQLVSL